MTVEVETGLLERRLNGLKKVADMGGAHNEYPAIYRHFVETLEFLGLGVSIGADGRHCVGKAKASRTK